jgi:2,3-diketo-5-methylthio-1-phosphopentane phosphatase
MEKWNFKIFADFDGTISQKDVGEEIFRKFADEEKVNPVISDLLGDKITSRDCWNLLIGSANPVDKKLLDEFIIGQEIENSFPRFVEYCEENEFELFILSDGFDYYIKKILDRKKEFGKLKVYANTWQITDTGRIIPEFPFYDDTFKSSANCKRNHIISNSSDEDYTVFIGDGNSDKDAIEYCDYIFAKSDLLKYCEKERITYFPFNNFDDVITKLEELKKKKRLKKRHQAVLNRRKAYMVE